MKRIESVSTQNLMNEIISWMKLKEVVELLDIIKKYDLNYKSKRE